MFIYFLRRRLLTAHILQALRLHSRKAASKAVVLWHYYGRVSTRRPRHPGCCVYIHMPMRHMRDAECRKGGFAGEREGIGYPRAQAMKGHPNQIHQLSKHRRHHVILARLSDVVYSSLDSSRASASRKGIGVQRMRDGPASHTNWLYADGLGRRMAPRGGSTFGSQPLPDRSACPAH